MSSPSEAFDRKVDVKISKETGGAYADIREVIESELARINQEWADRGTDKSHNGSKESTHDDRNGSGLK